MSTQPTGLYSSAFVTEKTLINHYPHREFETAMIKTLGSDKVLSTNNQPSFQLKSPNLFYCCYTTTPKLLAFLAFTEKKSVYFLARGTTEWSDVTTFISLPTLNVTFNGLTPGTEHSSKLRTVCCVCRTVVHWSSLQTKSRRSSEQVVAAKNTLLPA